MRNTREDIREVMEWFNELFDHNDQLSRKNLVHGLDCVVNVLKNLAIENETLIRRISHLERNRE